MTDQSSSAGVLMIRAWRDAEGLMQIRLTEVVESEGSELDMTVVSTDNDALALVRSWLERVRG